MEALAQGAKGICEKFHKLRSRTCGNSGEKFSFPIAQSLGLNENYDEISLPAFPLLLLLLLPSKIFLLSFFLFN